MASALRRMRGRALGRSPSALRSGAVGWAAAAVILAVAFAVSPNFKWTDAPRVGPYAGDFLQEYTGGRIALAGDRARLYDPDYFAQLQHDPAVVGFAWPSDT